VPQKIRVNSRLGLIQIYTGDGKGKTTTAVGQAVRALGQGLKVCFIQFFKDPKTFSYGEQKIFHSLPRTILVRGLPQIDFHTFAPRHPHFFKKISPKEIRKNLEEGLNFIKKIFQENRHNLLILDEIIIALRDKFISPDELIRILRKKPKDMEIILTGRGTPKKLINFADLVTEMKKIKHPYDKGVKARKGIEY
jgi:cob(I)alamin adenosyltransferase